jgi:heat shock protein beta
VHCRYLTFMKGLVDSDTLPLSVSRETLQASPSLKTIKKKLVRKALDMIKRMADAEKETEDGVTLFLPHSLAVFLCLSLY